MTRGIDKLWETIETRSGSDPETSYTAMLLSRGLGRIAQKVGEEAVETVIEAARVEAGVAERSNIAAESAELLNHLLVLWKAAGLTPGDIDAVLDAREAQSGIEEKNSRARG